jgi:hypothetical protein
MYSTKITLNEHSHKLVPRRRFSEETKFSDNVGNESVMDETAIDSFFH